MLSKVHSRDAPDIVREAPELRASVRDARPDLDHLHRHLLAHRPRHELHGAQGDHAHPLHVLQLGLPHLLIHGVLLHPQHRHAPALLEDLPRYQVG